jgi:hypothetical protein
MGRGQRGPSASGGGMSPIMMGVLGLLAYKAIKSLGSGQPGAKLTGAAGGKNPVSGGKSGPHQDPEKDERYRRDHEFEHATRATRLPVAAEYPCPCARIRHATNIQLSFMHLEASYRWQTHQRCENPLEPHS